MAELCQSPSTHPRWVISTLELIKPKNICLFALVTKGNTITICHNWKFHTNTVGCISRCLLDIAYNASKFIWCEWTRVTVVTTFIMVQCNRLHTSFKDINNKGSVPHFIIDWKICHQNICGFRCHSFLLVFCISYKLQELVLQEEVLLWQLSYKIEAYFTTPQVFHQCCQQIWIHQ